MQSGTVGTSGQVLTSNGAGALPTFQTPAGASLSNFTEAANSSSPNGTVPVVSLTATNAATNVDVALKPKGTGALTMHIADSTSAGGDKRGGRAVDLQTSRTTAAQVASGVGSVLIGGSNSTASGSAAAVIGGLTNTASQNNAGVFVGASGTASGTDSVVLGGTNNTASNTYAGVVAGAFNQATGDTSIVLGGAENKADGSYSSAMGQQAFARGIYGAHAMSAGQLGVLGDAQTRHFVLRSDTTNATPEALTTNNGAAGTTNQIVLPNNSVFSFFGQLTVRQGTTGDSKSIEFKGSIKRGANAAATALQGTVTQADIGTPDAGLAASTV